jgi:hypothetical protein
MSEVQICCPNCTAPLRSRGTIWPGKQVVCPRCGKPFTATVSVNSPAPAQPAEAKSPLHLFWGLTGLGIGFLAAAAVVVVAVIMINARNKTPPSVPELAVASSPVQPSEPDREDRREVRRLRAALHEMREAQIELRDSKDDLGGFRESALHALGGAVDQTEKCLRAAGQPIEVDPPEKSTYADYSNRPHLRHCLKAIREARDEVGQVKHDFGGHRDRALRDLDAAAAAVKKALEVVDGKSKDDRD